MDIIYSGAISCQLVLKFKVNEAWFDSLDESRRSDYVKMASQPRA